MATNETMGDKKPANLPGVYRHEGAGVEIVTAPGFKGSIQADAAVQVGYKYVGAKPKTQAVKTDTPTK